jgi:type VI protein secretion system component Hcp
MSDFPRRSILPLALLSLVAAAVLLGGRLTSEAAPAAVPAQAAAVPAAEAVGKVTFQFGTGLAGSQLLTLRSFAWSGSSAGSTGSGGGSTGGAFTGGNPTINIDASSFSPMLLKAMSTGAHWPSVTVVLYRPGTTTPFDQWKFFEVQLREVRATQSGPPSRFPREQVTWTWGRVRRDVFAANGTSVLGTYCWTISTLSSACP